jgi:hypothetical protein
MRATTFAGRRLVLGALSTIAVFAAACDDDPSEPIPGGGDPEVISRVTIQLTPQDGGGPQTSTVVDADGTSGPNPPSAPTGTLALTQGTTYDGTIEILNDLDPGDVVDVTEEVGEESEFHRFIYTFSCEPDVQAPVESYDTDTQDPPQPLGLTYEVVVAAEAAATDDCTLNVELRHFETNKGDGTGTNFETDLDLDFPVTVE